MLDAISLVLPGAAFGLLWWAFVQHLPRVAPQAGRRSALVLAFVAFELLVNAVSEALSLGHHLTHGGVVGAWAVIVAGLAAVQRNHLVATFRRSSLGPTIRGWRAAGFDVLAPVGVALAMLGPLVAIVVRYRPSNADSLAYHLPRVEQWVQNRTVANFATHYLVQLEFPPLSSYNLLHLHLLTGTDRLDGFPQLAALVVCAVGASDVARLLGGAVRAQAIAVLISATTPIAVLEATTTQNDLIAAALATGIVVVALLWWRGGDPAAAWVGLAATMSAALVVKSTAVLAVAPLAMAVAGASLTRAVRRDGATVVAKATAAPVAAGLAIALLVAGPFYGRNLGTFDSPVGPWSSALQTEAVSPAGSLSIAVRNTAANFDVGAPSSLLATVAGVPRRALEQVHDRLGVELDDQRFAAGILVDPFESRDYDLSSRIEDVGANPFHVTLIGVTGAVLAVLALRGRRRARLPAAYGACLVAGFLAISALTKYQQFGVRLMLPLFVAWSPVIAVFLARANAMVGRAVVVVLVVASVPQLVDSELRSLVSPTYPFASPVAGYFGAGGGSSADAVVAQDYERVAAAIAAAGCERVGIGNRIVLEYPLWAALREHGFDGIVANVDITDEPFPNPSADLVDPTFEPCAVVRRAEPSGLSVELIR